MRSSQVKKYKSPYKLFIFISKLVLIWYLVLFTGMFLNTSTDAVFTESHTFDNKIHADWDSKDEKVQDIEIEQNTEKIEKSEEAEKSSDAVENEPESHVEKEEEEKNVSEEGQIEEKASNEKIADTEKITEEEVVETEEGTGEGKSDEEKDI